MLAQGADRVDQLPWKNAIKMMDFACLRCAAISAPEQNNPWRRLRPEGSHSRSSLLLPVFHVGKQLSPCRWSLGSIAAESSAV